MIYRYLLCVEEKEDAKAIKGEKEIMQLLDRRLYEIEESNLIKRFSLRPIKNEMEE